ncbi:hypothetical protein GS597_11395 [Synechococcales cyanobacterium C]|uniref:Tic20 family protein Ycf60 n=1 Tax=Petrachloros mirabilis ULC683 TaxID=2781853 RepID=A0A8K2A7N7_9CYAN|nr:Tic20 family protein [Petrachloros mirabilis]NCJ07101.1 hypothetical protein [Petrachloros mirabilis ULC683]
MNWRGTTTVRDRIFSGLPYLLPLLDSLFFAQSFFHLFPQLTFLFVPLLPVLALYSIPFASLILFFGLFLLVVRNERIPHIIRFNTMQALLVDIVLILCRLILQLVGGVSGFAFILKTVSTSIFLGVAAIFVYGVVQSLRGRYAEIPTLSDAVYMQVR